MSGYYYIMSRYDVNPSCEIEILEKHNFFTEVGSNPILLYRDIKYIKFIPRGAWKMFKNLSDFVLLHQEGAVENLKHPTILQC